MSHDFTPVQSVNELTQKQLEEYQPGLYINLLEVTHAQWCLYASNGEQALPWEIDFFIESDSTASDVVAQIQDLEAVYPCLHLKVTGILHIARVNAETFAYVQAVMHRLSIRKPSLLMLMNKSLYNYIKTPADAEAIYKALKPKWRSPLGLSLQGEAKREQRDITEQEWPPHFTDTPGQAITNNPPLPDAPF